MVRIKSYPAKNGDAFLIQSTADSFAMLIDGGYKDTFIKYIRSDLEVLAADNVALDMVVATHVDADHIGGLLAFFQENGSSESPSIIAVREVLHNSLRSLTKSTMTHMPARSDNLALLKDIRSRGYLIPDDIDNLGRQISATQGNALSQLLLDGGYQWNTCKGEISIGGELSEIRCDKTKIKILGPSEARLSALLDWWTRQMRRSGFIGPLQELDDVFEYLCSHEVVEPDVQLLALSEHDLQKGHLPDKSVTNGSSISLIVEVEDCRLLFLGDSWAEDMVIKLEPNGLTIFDAVKISHHGSIRNTSPDFLKLVDSPHFFISTDGSGHSHPDLAVLKAIVDRPAAFFRTLHFNYSTPASQALKAYACKNDANFFVSEGSSEWVSINGLIK